MLSNDNILRLNARSEGLTALSTKEIKQNPRVLLAAIAPDYKIPTGVQAPNPPVAGTTTPAAPGSANTVNTGPNANVNLNVGPTPPPGTTAIVVRPGIPGAPGIFGFPVYGFAPAHKKPQPTAATKIVAPPARYWPTAAAATNGALAVAPVPQAPLVLGPDAELARYRGLIQAPGRCKSCRAESGKTIKVRAFLHSYVVFPLNRSLQTTPTFTHHACASCLEVICRGCWSNTGCEWDCQCPFDGTLCKTAKCCAPGRAVSLFEVLCKLDCAVRHPISPFRLATKEKTKAKATQHIGDDALVRILDAIRRLLPHPGEKESLALDIAPHPSLASMLLTSALPEVLGTLFAVPFEEWNARKPVYTSALALIRCICESPAAMPMLVNPLVKKATNGLRAFVESRGKVIWAHPDPNDTEIDPKTAPAPPNSSAPVATAGITGVKPLSEILVDVFNSAVNKMAEFEALPEDDVTDAVLETMATLDGVLEVGEQFVLSIKAYQTVVLARANAATTAPTAAAGVEADKIAPPAEAEKVMGELSDSIAPTTTPADADPPALVPPEDGKASSEPAEEDDDVDGAPLEDDLDDAGVPSAPPDDEDLDGVAME